MKRIWLLLSACCLLMACQSSKSASSSYPDGGGDGGIESSEGGTGSSASQSDTPPSDILERAIYYLNSRNYNMEYGVDVHYDIPPAYKSQYGSLFQDGYDGPYYFQVDGKKIRLNGPGVTDEYYDVTTPTKATRYYKNSSGEYEKTTFDFTAERNQIKFFDQRVHSSMDFVAGSSANQYLLKSDLLEENDFDSLTMTLECNNDDISRITIEGQSTNTITMPPDAVITAHQTITGVFTNFGTVEVTLPTV